MPTNEFLKLFFRKALSDDEWIPIIEEYAKKLKPFMLWCALQPLVAVVRVRDIWNLRSIDTAPIIQAPESSLSLNTRAIWGEGIREEDRVTLWGLTAMMFWVAVEVRFSRSEGAPSEGAIREIRIETHALKEVLAKTGANPQLVWERLSDVFFECFGQISSVHEQMSALNFEIRDDHLIFHTIFGCGVE